jgi:N-acetylglucosamine-6-phosphate deacetylase
MQCIADHATHAYAAMAPFAIGEVGSVLNASSLAL